MLDAGIDVIGYAAFVQSRYWDYVGIHKNLDALHHYLLNTPDPDIVNYDLQTFLVTLRAAREAMPALAAATAALEPLLTEERISRKSGQPPDRAKLIRRLHSKRQQFASFFGELSDLNDVVARFFPLLLEEPDETVLSYLEMKEKIRATRGNPAEAQLDATSKRKNKTSRTGRKQSASHQKRKAKRRAPPTLNYYRPASAAVTDCVTRAQDFRVWTVPVSIKELYEQHGLELTKAQRAWLQYAKETWAKKSTMRWVPADEGGLVLGHLPQKVIDPVGSPPEIEIDRRGARRAGNGRLPSGRRLLLHAGR